MTVKQTIFQKIKKITQEYREKIMLLGINYFLSNSYSLLLYLQVQHAKNTKKSKTHKYMHEHRDGAIYTPAVSTVSHYSTDCGCKVGKQRNVLAKGRVEDNYIFIFSFVSCEPC